MRKQFIALVALFVFFLSGCGLVGLKTGKNGELTGVVERSSWDNPVPYGMVLIPHGSFHLGQNDQDVNSSQDAYRKQITVSAFYIDDTEISNNEYRQFLQASQGEDEETSYVDSVMMFLERYYGYKLTPQQYMEMIIPDSLVWVRDFSYTYNEPIVENYNWHPAFDGYPVVGVNWYAAQAFCYWRTEFYNKFRTERGLSQLPRFRLPTEAEWEYAARGGYEHKIFPWEGPYVRNSKGCFLANFKPGRGDYVSDNFEYTSPVRSYWPNDYGLYNMPGNVAEWCEDDFEETGYTYGNELNPIYRDPRHITRKKIIRGGSWKDVGYFLSVGTRTYEYADLTKSFIGFRCVVSLIGNPNL